MQPVGSAFAELEIERCARRQEKQRLEFGGSLRAVGNAFERLADLSGKMGMVYLKSTNVEVILNGVYAGNYQLVGNVRIDKSRVNIHNWEDVASDAAKAIAKKEGIKGEAKDALEDYMTTNISAKKFSRLAILMSDEKEDTRLSIDGTYGLDELDWQTFTPDKDSLQEAILQLFYEKEK